MAMQLVRTKALMCHGVDGANPHTALALVLESALELVSLPDNDFSWSSWEDSSHATAEVQSLLEQVRSGALPIRLKVSVLFAPTGPIQEVSLSSGWADSFLKLAEKYDEVEALLWKDHG